MESEQQVKDRLERYEYEIERLKSLKDKDNLTEKGYEQLNMLEDFAFVCKCILSGG